MKQALPSSACACFGRAGGPQTTSVKISTPRKRLCTLWTTMPIHALR
jgi:hypothetical protein